MVVNNIFYSPESLKDLDDIGDYITYELSSPLAAYNLLTEITKTVDLLKNNPLMGASINSIANIVSDYRFLVVKNYLVFYRYTKNNIYIDRVLYSKSHYLSVLLKQ